MNRFIIRSVEIWRNPSAKHRFYSITAMIVLLMLSWAFVYFNGGTIHAYVHLMYVPIIIAAFIWGITGGFVTAIAAGILVGPLMPLDVENNLSQPTSSFLLRMLFFIIISLVVGNISVLLKRYIIFANNTFEQLSSTYANTLRNYAKMVSARDEQTSHHCERVAYNSSLVGREYGLEQRQTEALYWAGLLHDVGKIGVKENVLLKPGKLTAEEFMEIQKHTILGYELVTSLSHDLYLISEGIRSHHEKWNGQGYPDGLKEEQIPIFGRIITVVDVFEALTAIRPYKNSWSSQDAIDYIVQQKGISFDPKIVDIFAKLYHEKKIWVFNEEMELDESVIPKSFQMNMDEQMPEDKAV